MARHLLPQQASEPMQVDCDDRDADGAFEPLPGMHAHPVQAMAFQRMDPADPKARMPLSPSHERGLTLPGSLRRRNVGTPFSKQDHLKYVLMKYTFYILSCLQTIHPKKCIRIFLRRRLPDVLLTKIRSDPSETLKTTHFNASNGNLHPQHFSSKHPPMPQSSTL